MPQWAVTREPSTTVRQEAPKFSGSSVAGAVTGSSSVGAGAARTSAATAVPVIRTATEAIAPKP
ncbi:hypothetical protein SVTN_08720 [Streptomyces vietnamensis]|uniref:Uncharacterized protein n=1 Tax=Streptomyces vietnamensis TaxID=362257 RepID=A0A0B5HVJ5_9ACTN|nr:hypothetical protein SVTN_08720 [Streptomyces vietnamensis]